jgi:hypothetical protein
MVAMLMMMLMLMLMLMLIQSMLMIVVVGAILGRNTMAAVTMIVWYFKESKKEKKYNDW